MILSILLNFSITSGGTGVTPFTQRVTVDGTTPAIYAAFCFEIPVLFSNSFNSSFIFSPFLHFYC